MKEQQKISNEELLKMVESGLFFNFCTGMALNLGHENAIKSDQEVKFQVGDYDVTFDRGQLCFVLAHRVFPARIITAYVNKVFFIGQSEEEVISELLAEARKELEQ